MKFALLFVIAVAVLARCPSASTETDNKGEAERRAEDIAIVQRTWPAIMKEAEKNGLEIFKTYLEKFNYYSIFRELNGLAHDDSIKRNKTFKAIAGVIFSNVNSAVSNAANTQKVESQLKALGKDQEGRGVTKQHVDRLFEVIKDRVNATLQLDPRQQTAYHNVLELFSGFMKSGLKQ